MIPDWHIPADVRAPLVLDDGINMRIIRHLLAVFPIMKSLSDSLPCADIGLCSFICSVTGDTPAFDGTEEVPSSKRVRLPIDDEKTMVDLIPLLERLDQKIKIAIDHRPCFSPPEGMKCIMNEGVPFTWIWLPFQKKKQNLVLQNRDARLKILGNGLHGN